MKSYYQVILLCNDYEGNLHESDYLTDDGELARVIRDYLNEKEVVVYCEFRIFASCKTSSSVLNERVSRDEYFFIHLINKIKEYV